MTAGAANLSEGAVVLVTGGAGFIGSNLADRLLARGCRVRILDSLERPGVERNLAWLSARHGPLVEPVIADVRDAGAIALAVRGVDGAFHLAAQVAVTTSLADPAADFAVNLGGTFALLEALRRERPGAPLIFASTNKVYGDLADTPFRRTDAGYVPRDPALARHGVAEDRGLDFHTPYGCSKGAADQYVLDYARSFGMPAAVLRMSCIYGERQMGTEDQGWVAHFLLRALAGEPIMLYGDGHQVRDICDVADTCAAYIAAFERIETITGRAFNWGGGADNAVSLLTLVAEIRRILGTAPRVDFADWRAGDQRWFVADTRAADAALGLPARKSWRSGLADLAAWLSANHSAPAPRVLARESAA
ncbi:MAG: NAD-dependent epimerase/dehydratase family protein [Erythrobacter sp.]|uniref:NAD-dependent epimerase/dehydratase family protein n=1 Tax=Erythrobacter sp. TaxID=1042 RepID=UPI0025D75009|nr:NAD-dependent epimerase/dehydratase family protein [Erythrobacter sp.]MCM0000610.1 NAD-dependent epimerase/dehydratase family protein [Erythrobacter sp.]